MSNMIQSVRGMADIWGTEALLWSELETKIRKLFYAYGFEELRTPLVEYEALFKRGVGEGTDIVEKEMYSFMESDSEKASRLVLRPEGTAAVVRALIEHKTYQTLPLRYFYMGPMYRKERPQKGRSRQFHQYGFEILGESSSGSDAESIQLVYQLFKNLDLKNFEIHLNSLGDSEDRVRYRQILVNYFTKYMGDLSELSRSRLQKNPLRIFDSKDEKDQKIALGAPKIADFLGLESQRHHQRLLELLHQMSIPFRSKEQLVRGLDYYNRTVFEVVDTSTHLGAQNALGGGGRYDGLSKDLGGPDLPAFGFAGGFERLILALAESFVSSQSQGFEASFVHIGEAAFNISMVWVLALRAKGLRIDMDFDSVKSIKSQFKRADRLKSRHVIIVGEQELERNILKLKNMESGSEEEIHLPGGWKNFQEGWVLLQSKLRNE